MASNKCLHGPCNRKVDINGPYDGYCYDHYRYSPSVVKAYSDTARDPGLASIGRVDISVPTDQERLHSDLVGFTNLDSGMASILVDSVGDMSKGRDLTVPNIAMGEQEIASRSLRDAMVRNGADPARIEKLSLTGLHRRVVTSGAIQSMGEYDHDAIIIDRGTDRETVVDPVISTFAPVYDRDQPVDDQIPSGETPFGDAPFVGSYQDYVDGYHLWWDRDQVSSW